MAVQWADLGVGIGIALMIEGAAYAIAPDGMRRLYALMLKEPAGRLRTVGAICAVLGFGLLWLIRG